MKSNMEKVAELKKAYYFGKNAMLEYKKANEPIPEWVIFRFEEIASQLIEELEKM